MYTGCTAINCWSYDLLNIFRPAVINRSYLLERALRAAGVHNKYNTRIIILFVPRDRYFGHGRHVRD